MGQVQYVRRIRELGFIVETRKGWFVRPQGETSSSIEAAQGVQLVQEPITGVVPLGSAGAVILSEHEVFWARLAKDGVELTRTSSPVKAKYVLPHTIISIGHGEALVEVLPKHLLWFKALQGGLQTSAVDLSPVGEFHWFVFSNRSSSLLVQTSAGLHFIQRKEGSLTLVPATDVPSAGMQEQYFDLDGKTGGRLLRPFKTWFFAADDSKRLEVVERGPRGEVKWVTVWPGLGWLLFAEAADGSHSESLQEWWLARRHGQSIQFERLATELTGRPLLRNSELVATPPLVWARHGPFQGNSTPPERWSTTALKLDDLQASPADTRNDRVVDISVNHPCAALLSQSRFKVVVSGPEGRTATARVSGMRPALGGTVISVSTRLDAQGTWKIALQVGSDDEGWTPVGPAWPVVVPAPLRDLKEAAGWLAASVAALFAGANIFVLLLSPSRSWAWRVATDSAISSKSVRLLTTLICHWQWGVVRLVDLYFRESKASFGATVSPYLPLPLTRTGAIGEDPRNRPSALLTSVKVLAPSWRGKRVWICGNSGMGKTTLFNSVVSSHFRDHATAPEAWGRWGAIIVAFAARDHVATSDNESSPSWVIQAVRASLAPSGLTFEDESLLRRILQSGAIAIAIDGVHEAARSRSVEAFARAFPLVPMLVTSQEPAVPGFEMWALPEHMRDFTEQFVHVHVNSPERAAEIVQRIQHSGIQDVLQSGYDIKLLVDLLVGDHNAKVPSDRTELYATVVRMAWPPSTRNEKPEDQQMRLCAIAWSMVSESSQHDKRRFEAESSVDATLLDMIADAPARFQRPIRLLMREGRIYQFVHDQMNAYLAASWFAKPGVPVHELQAMVEKSTIWADSPSSRTTLWTFVAALLDEHRLLGLWEVVDEELRWSELRLALQLEAKRRGLVPRYQFPPISGSSD